MKAKKAEVVRDFLMGTLVKATASTDPRVARKARKPRLTEVQTLTAQIIAERAEHSRRQRIVHCQLRAWPRIWLNVDKLCAGLGRRLVRSGRVTWISCVVFVDASI